MTSLFTKVGNAFRSSQLFGSSIHPGAEAVTSSPLQSSYLKSKPSKKRKSIEDGGSGKKKHKKQRHSLNIEEEFDGFSDTKANAQGDLGSSMLNLNGGDEVQSSSKKSKNGKAKHKSKKQPVHENDDDWEDVVPGDGIIEEVEEPPTDVAIATIQDIDMVEPPSSKKKKKNKKKSRKSLESLNRTDDTDVQVAEQLFQEEARDATPVPLVFNGVTTEPVTKSEKRIKKRILSSPPQLVGNGVLIENEEPTLPSPTQLSSAKKKKKKSKKKKADVAQEDNVLAMDDQRELLVNGDADTTMQDETLHENIIIPSSLLSPQEVRKSVKKIKSKGKLIDVSNENIPEGPLDYQAKSRKSRKKKEPKLVRRSLSDDFAGVLHADSLDNAKLQVSGHDDVNVDQYANSIQGSEPDEEMHDDEVLNGIQQPYESAEPEIIVELPEPESLGESDKKSKGNKKKSKSKVLEVQVPSDDEPPALKSPVQNIQTPTSKKAMELEQETPSTSKASKSRLKTYSSKLKKSKSRDRENAFKKSFGESADEASDEIQDESTSEHPASSSWQAVNEKNSGMLNGAESGENAEIDEDAHPESPVNDASAKQPAVKTSKTSSKRKRSNKDEGEVNPEALRLPTKKRRTRKSVEKSGEKNPEALRLPEKMGSKKAAPKKRATSTAGAASSRDVMRTGPFSEEEAETIKSVLDSFGETHELSEYAVRQILHDNARTNEKTSSLLKELYDTISDRTPESIVKVARRKFHNFPRYGQWTAEEDEELRQAFEKHGNKWVKISGEIDRHPEDIRDRWRNVVVCGENLDKGPWTKEEEDEMMKKIQKRLDNIRKAWGAKVYVEELTKGKTEYEILDWALISKDMGSTRSRLQCQQKYKQITNRYEPGASWTRKEDPETNSWRTKKARAEVTFMKPGDKLMLLVSIQRAAYGREETIKFQKLGDLAFQKNFSEKAKKLALKYIRNDVPGEEEMTLQDVITHAIENLETEFPGRLQERYNPEVDGETYPTRPKRKSKTSSRRVSESDDEDEDGNSLSQEKTNKTPKLRDRMKQNQKAQAVQVEKKNEDAMDLDQGDDEEEDDISVSEEDVQTKVAQSRSSPLDKSASESPQEDVEPEIQESEDESSRPASSRPSRQVSEPASYSDAEEEKEQEQEDDVGSIDLGATHDSHTDEPEHDNVPVDTLDHDSVVSDGEDDEDEDVGEEDVEEEIEEEEKKPKQKPIKVKERDIYRMDSSDESEQEQEEEASNSASQREISLASSRGRSFRLAQVISNPEDVEISSDDSFGDIPAVRPGPVAASLPKLPISENPLKAVTKKRVLRKR